MIQTMGIFIITQKDSMARKRNQVKVYGFLEMVTHQQERKVQTVPGFLLMSCSHFAMVSFSKQDKLYFTVKFHNNIIDDWVNV